MGSLPVRSPWLRVPHAEPGMAIGLFGGSFNPPHDGHLLVSATVLRRLRLDRLWWMVTPGNPLKDTRELSPLESRLEACEALATDPRIVVTAFEAARRTRFTIDMLAWLVARNPDVRFVWVMGADSLATFHRWRRWRDIAEMVPIAVVDRPGSTLSLLSSPMARRYASSRLDEDDARLLPSLAAPAWTFLHGPRSPTSSTGIRSEKASS